MKNILSILLLVTCSTLLKGQVLSSYSSNNELRYDCMVTQISPQKYSIEVTRTNIGDHKLLVMNDIDGQDFDTLKWHHYFDSVERPRLPFGWDYVDTLHSSRGYFDRDTLIDLFTVLESQTSWSNTFLCNASARTKVLLPKSVNKWKFSIRT